MQKIDLIVGTQAIADAIGVTARRVRFMVSRKEIPVFRLGGSITIRRATLVSWIACLEAAGA